jgi:hypothetical protein
MGIVGDLAADLAEVLVHGEGIADGHDQRRRVARRWADRAKHIGRGEAKILWRRRGGCRFAPTPGSGCFVGHRPRGTPPPRRAPVRRRRHSALSAVPPSPHSRAAADPGAAGHAILKCLPLHSGYAIRKPPTGSARPIEPPLHAPPLEHVRDHQNPLADPAALAAYQAPQLCRPRFAEKKNVDMVPAARSCSSADSFYHILGLLEAGISRCHL